MLNLLAILIILLFTTAARVFGLLILWNQVVVSAVDWAKPIGWTYCLLLGIALMLISFKLSLKESK